MDLESWAAVPAGRGGRGAAVCGGWVGRDGGGRADRLAEMAAFCRERGLWFHVDGAYGAFAAGVEGSAPAEMAGLALADSVAVDPHKWLYAPLEAGCALVRDASHLRGAFLSSAVLQLRRGGDQLLRHRSAELARVPGVEGVALQHAGAARYRETIGDDMALARHMFEAAAGHPELEAVTQSLSITTLRYVPAAFKRAWD